MEIIEIASSKELPKDIKFKMYTHLDPQTAARWFAGTIEKYPPPPVVYWIKERGQVYIPVPQKG